jgi:hypothetical protein
MSSGKYSRIAAFYLDENYFRKDAQKPARALLPASSNPF